MEQTDRRTNRQQLHLMPATLVEWGIAGVVRLINNDSYNIDQPMRRQQHLAVGGEWMDILGAK